jgi:hypothetical protein
VPRLGSATRPSTPRLYRSAPRIKPSCGLPPLPPHQELARQLEGLPKDLGVTLVVLGIFGVVILGPIPPGFSFILMGVIALRPTLIERSGASLARRWPRLLRILIGLVAGFRRDLARRYPGSVPPELPVRTARGG